MLTASGCGPDIDQTLSENERKAVAEAVTNRVEAYVNSMKDLDIDKMLSFWADSENFVKAGDGFLLVGYEKFAALQREKMSKVATVKYVNTMNPNIYVLAKDAASFSFEFEWSMTGTSGDIMNSKGSWTYVFKKFGDEWKVIHSTGSHLND
jgi:ketosteroid isomerase-like protein